MVTLIINIANLVGICNKNELLRGKKLAQLNTIEHAFVLIEDGIIAQYGYMQQLSLAVPNLPKHIIDATNQTVLPAWCDSHTHIVFAGSRETEFVDKINGLSYADIAAKGGGILNSAEKLQHASEDELYHAASKRLTELSKLGTGAIEIKSGYGLTVAAELKMLRVIKRLKQQSDVSIKATFLGAHTYPISFKQNHQGYIDSIIHEMLPIIAAESLADYIDVFCETGFFRHKKWKVFALLAKHMGYYPNYILTN